MIREAAALVLAAVLAGLPALAQEEPVRKARVLLDVPLRADPAPYGRFTGRLTANRTILAVPGGEWCAVLAREDPDPARAVGYAPCEALELGQAAALDGEGVPWELARRDAAREDEVRLAVVLQTQDPPLGETLEGLLFEAVTAEARSSRRVVVEAYLPGMDLDRPGFAEARYESGRSAGLVIRRSVLMLHRASQP